MWAYSRNEKGMTLIEVLASIVILSIALLLLSNFLVRGLELSGKEDSKLVAMNLARQLAEAWRSGNGDLTSATMPIDLPSALSANKLTYPQLAQLTEYLKDYDVKEISFPAVEVNERHYQQKLSLSFLDDAAYDLQEKTMILITVRVTSPEGKELALLQSAMANPEKGGISP
ncbi:prepilin-type N-terminal cleavage/methylation domain-containing protein [Brevibacillus ruminantium]|uniref:Prepilin-type N-terminal cleavage/methylation domain-containing protein n=1 Tax=Brevibacillus ruminantium TaxID=2950604 RepID=A0ABY4WCP3_9BACL|nr:prepilin-type N-terminal cleavage/methylation domain-containing protein [Brevibacillus ruminantium]USG64674.1 prepilin-type N-terminal cleavage/methylation domain-containing protein [Brevibacillus ruminantium]